MGDRSKLPKWAQEEMKDLEANLATLEARMREVFSDFGDGTNTVVHGNYGESDIGLPNNAQVSYLLGDHEIRAGVRRGIYEDHLEIYSTSGPIVIEPQVANVVHVRGRHL